MKRPPQRTMRRDCRTSIVNTLIARVFRGTLSERPSYDEPVGFFAQRATRDRGLACRGLHGTEAGEVGGAFGLFLGDVGKVANDDVGTQINWAHALRH